MTILQELRKAREICGLTTSTDVGSRIDGVVDIRALQAAGSRKDHLKFSLGALSVVGEVVNLQDRRFSREIAENGLWHPFDFLFDVNPGVYFLEHYDPKKIPVLFIHGVNGTPRDFSYLIDHLDRMRFQPWVYYYPSGAPLDYIAELLEQVTVKLHAIYGIKKLYIVSHSVGGLVSRAFILKHLVKHSEVDIPVFISISTPWNGVEAAELGVRYAPVAVQSWVDIAPDSYFLRRIFFRDPLTKATPLKLPSSVKHYLIFGFRPKLQISEEYNDSRVSLTSELRWEAQSDAMKIYGLVKNHAEILNCPDVSSLLNDIFAKDQ